MITKSHRFHGYNSLRFVYQKGETVRGPLCAIKYVVNERRDTYRLAVIVSKKVTKSAVKRNRIRRRLYEAFRAYETKITQPYDIAVTVFNDQLRELPTKEIDLLVRSQLKQAGIIQ